MRRQGRKITTARLSDGTYAGHWPGAMIGDYVAASTRDGARRAAEREYLAARMTCVDCGRMVRACGCGMD